jgi:uncharacterized membrane protein YuzA (DUF378 family)
MELPDLNARELTTSATAVGAINWGLQEAFSVNLLADYVPEFAGLGYLVLGAAGAIVLSEQLELVEVFD